MNDYEIQKIRDTAFCSGYNTAVSKYENKIAELEKENAELKAVERMALYSKMSDQLAKAKEILADIIKFQPYINRDTMFLSVGNNWKEVIYKAEQFIKDSDVEK